jgi:hypothetical protein
MEYLLDKSDKKSRHVTGKRTRYLFDVIDWSERLIVILGYRGTGKTTLLLQNLKKTTTKGVYISMDDFYFETHRLIETVKQLYDSGFRLFLIDEVHRYLYWAKDLKQIYDDYDDIQVIATGSSILDISRGSSDLSRRASIYHLHGFSFGEYLMFKNNIQMPVLSLSDIIHHHHQLAPDLLDKFSYKKEFQNYLKYGYYPFFLDSGKTYYQKLQETINHVMETDIGLIEDLQHSTVRMMKKLLFVLSESVPFTPNISKLSERLGTPRNTILRLLDIMNQAQILQLLRPSAKGISYLQKPEKIYLQNTNMIYLFSPVAANMGSIRETFFFNQVSTRHTVTSAKFGDFMVDDIYTFEIGGASKTSEQIRGVPNSYLALHTESGNNKRIPLWLFGLLY